MGLRQIIFIPLRVHCLLKGNTVFAVRKERRQERRRRERKGKGRRREGKKEGVGRELAASSLMNMHLHTYPKCFLGST